MFQVASVDAGVIPRLPSRARFGWHVQSACGQGWSAGLWYLSFNCITLSTEVREVIMAANALVQTRIDVEVRDRATAVLESMGLTVSDAVRILLTRTANEGALPLELVTNSEAHDAWFRVKVREAMEDTRPDIPEDRAEAHFAERRAGAARRADKLKS